MTLLLTHPASLAHRVPAGHPERPERLRAVERALGPDRFPGLARREAGRASLDTVALVHPREWIDALVEAVPREGLVGIDSDTILSPGTLDAVLHGVGAAVEGVDAVVTGAARNAFAATRPPGHHAERTRAMGFCFFNTAAIAARHAQVVHGLGRVAIVDWDVHHGNGTQDIVWSDPDTLYCSTHQMPLYPGTGAPGERGDHDTVVNVPLAAGTDGPAFRAAFEAAILPRVEGFRPDLIVVSAGFDAHRRDPLGGLRLDEADFAWATRRLMEIADRVAGGRLVSVLEGGYDLDALGGSAAAHVAALMEA